MEEKFIKLTILNLFKDEYLEQSLANLAKGTIYNNLASRLKDTLKITLLDALELIGYDCVYAKCSSNNIVKTRLSDIKSQELEDGSVEYFLQLNMSKKVREITVLRGSTIHTVFSGDSDFLEKEDVIGYLKFFNSEIETTKVYFFDEEDSMEFPQNSIQRKIFHSEGELFYMPELNIEYDKIPVKSVFETFKSNINALEMFLTDVYIPNKGIVTNYLKNGKKSLKVIRNFDESFDILANNILILLDTSKEILASYNK